MASVTIIKTPRGEAPLWVREAWIGITLPTNHKRPKDLAGFGVLSGPTSLLPAIWRSLLGETERVTGYRVPSKVAIELLSSTQPEAADWWRSNAPTLMKTGQTFVFDSDACRLNEDTSK